ncbi:hypothetical protein [Paenibacillus campi]|uniref:hypothetical protein n=1 Tax=Paenibacillus campi TaxID=3106031 RepID=UPI002AFF4A0A|nr:hypothetical protein [Paenibacillus sp. SGZ-1014]
MALLNVLIYILIGSAFGFVVLLAVFQYVQRNNRHNGQAEMYKTYLDYVGSGRSKRIRQYNQFLQQSYYAYMSVPLLRTYIMRVRKRLQSIHSYDEFSMRRETMKVVFVTLAIVSAFILALLFMNKDLTFMFMIALTALVMNGMLIDAFVNRVENRLLVQLKSVMDDVRHSYQQHGMIEEALHDAAEASTHEAALHAKKVYEILVSSEPEKQLQSYYQAAPNRFLKAFAGISYLVKEFGDKTVADGSLYLSNMGKLTGEINLELLKRTKLSYLLKGLTMISIAPILFTKPIELWAKSNFPIMEQFYNSKFGFFSKIVIFAVILLSYILLKKLQDQQEGVYQAKVRKWLWEQKLLELRLLEWLVIRLMPAKRTTAHLRIRTLLKDANAGTPLEWHYLHRIVLATMLLIVMLSSLHTMHKITIHNIWTAPTQAQTMFGQLSADELAKAQAMTAFDTRMMQRLAGVDPAQWSERIMEELHADNPHLDRLQLTATVDRIEHKLQALHTEYFKWYELLLAFGMGYIGYLIPYWMLLFQKKIRHIDMQNEVEQFHTIIAMLCQIDRMSVDIMLEWMERFSTIFREPLHRAVLDFESGAEQALEALKQNAPFVPLARTIDKLILSVERIPIREAFDDLEHERNYNFEKRKQDYERMIETKSEWGRMIGFAPMAALTFIYLVLPFIYMSFEQMGAYYEQLNQL